MDIELFKEELNTGAAGFRAFREDDIESVILDYEVELTDFMLNLTAHSTLKLEASPIELEFLRKGVIKAIRVLYAVILKTGVGAYPIKALEDCLLKATVLSCDKNHDYSPYNITKAGNLGLTCRMGDKISRIANAVTRDLQLKVPESLLDTAVDLVNYAVYQVMVAMGRWMTPEEHEEFKQYWLRANSQPLSDFYSAWGEYRVDVLYTQRPIAAYRR